ncbi:hypothetical protein HDF14_001221 [Edaphobacter lichenicola]|uniref:Uncharacterized protein n=1 Tax=Tunturiibacter gelidiferens TaxID=3069689 RepID=A0A9X0QBS8_9BACT|nr:hypothetical protein [Edaphobacter lichenicola]
MAIFRLRVMHGTLLSLHDNSKDIGEKILLKEDVLFL